jgi:formate hydrogenlyase subunit 6/NADH:ubiquinone oxidoreductase subunit I
MEGYMIQIKSKLDCCGCTACASSCPKSAITMVPDEEGFLYPKIDMRRCIECGACERACPILNKKTVISEKTEGYIIRIKDNKILYESTSGGAFTALADYILEQNGIVYGAGYDNNMSSV